MYNATLGNVENLNVKLYNIELEYVERQTGHHQQLNIKLTSKRLHAEIIHI